VIEHYAEELREHRRRAGKTRSVLVVVIDADTRAVTDRLTELANALEEANLEKRAADDPVALLIPKRHIETWILCLSGETVDQSTDYERTCREDEIDGHFIRSAAMELFSWNRQNAVVPERCVPSLRMALPELKRLE
jgi:hypothetical protein